MAGFLFYFLPIVVIHISALVSNIRIQMCTLILDPFLGMDMYLYRMLRGLNTASLDVLGFDIENVWGNLKNLWAGPSRNTGLPVTLLHGYIDPESITCLRAR